MFFSEWRSFLRRPTRAQRRSRAPALRCEELERRCQPSVTPFFFSTGNPDGRIGSLTEPDNAHNNNDEFETGDDFVLPTETQLTQATFTGLLTGGATPAELSNVNVEIYQVFPKDSNGARTPKVPTRVNSPADVAFVLRDSADNKLNFTTTVLNPSFNVANSVATTARIAVGGASTPAPMSGEEVQFNLTFTPPLNLAPGQYFFVPHVGLSATAPAASDFLWLSAPLPIQPPGTPLTPDLQAWERFNGLKPDWLRLGTDIVGGTVFNESFSLTGTSFTTSLSSLSQNASAAGSGNLAVTVFGSEFTSQSTVLFNGQPLATTFVSSTQLQATIPAAILADEGTANVAVFDVQRGLSNAQTFTINAASAGDQNFRFVAQVFLDVLGRRVDPSGLAFFGGLLDAGLATRQQVVADITSSLEYRIVQVTQAYQQILQRAPDATGLNAFVQMLTNGGTVEQFKAALAGSQEFFSDAQALDTTAGLTTANQKYVDFLFQKTLNRTVDAPGLSTFTQQLANNVSRSTVALEVLTSPEGYRDVVESFYSQFLHRHSDTNGLNFFVGQLQKGVRDEVVIDEIVASDEYFGRV